MPIRSGRFKWDKPNDKPLTIIGVGAGKDSAFYRILNSGENDFKVTWGTTSRTVTLKPTMSIDIAARGTAVVISADADVRVEGIYDFLSYHHTVRSGRFRAKATTAGDPAPSHTIIDARGSSDAAFYRIYNSGEGIIKVVENPGNNPLVESLYPDLSFDFKVAANKRVHVEEFVPTTTPATEPVGEIEGIYEFLGE